jgi:hypothetical protein
VTGSGARSGYRPRRGDAKIMQMLLAGGTYQEAAVHAGIGERTVVRRMSDPHFVAELRRAQDQMLAAARRRAVWLASGAVEILKAVADDNTAPAGARVRAAEILWSRADPAPQRIDLAVTPSPYRDVEGRTPIEILTEAVERARQRMDPAALSANGERGGGGG